MYAERLILETDEHGFFKQKTSLPPNSKVEVIFLVLGKSLPIKRKPAQHIAGKATNSVDIDVSIFDLHNEANIIEALLANPLKVIHGDSKPLNREEIYGSRED